MNAPNGKANFLLNIPLTIAQRKKLCYAYLNRTLPAGTPLAQQMEQVDALLSMWQQYPGEAIESAWDRLQAPQQLVSVQEGPSTDNVPEGWPWPDGISLAEFKHGKPVDPTAKPIVKEEIIPDSEYRDPTLTKLLDHAVAKATKHETFSLDIVLNAKQQLAVEFAAAGKSFVLTGPAGSGKTTAEREIVKAMLRRWEEGTQGTMHKFKDKRTGTRQYLPPIAVVSFTNKAANNSAKAIHKDPELAEKLPLNVTTIHNLLEFEPLFFEREDGTTGMKFVPARNAANPLDIQILAIEEASNVGALDLYSMLYDAIRPGTVLIFIGDINQLPPIFSPSILNYALVQLPVVELDEIYRQALDSPIIANAHRILRGEMIEPKAPYFMHFNGARTSTLVSENKTCHQLIKSLKKQIDIPDPSSGFEPTYDPDQDIVLCPYNVGDAGTISINAHIAQFLGNKRGAEVWEIIVRMRKIYLAVGDRVMFMKREGVITRIAHNARYIGKAAQPPGKDLTRFGIRMPLQNGNDKVNLDDVHEDDFEELVGYENMDTDAIPDEEEDSRKQAASHIVDIRYDDESTDTLSTIGEFAEANFSLGYALTVHKSQGSEWRKVFLVLHKNQATHLNRELLYTAVTRARTHCIIIDFTDQLERAIKSQRVKGNTVAEKIAWFNSKISLEQPVKVTKEDW